MIFEVFRYVLDKPGMGSIFASIHISPALSLILESEKYIT